jgi:hypothetical protein
MIFRLPKGVRPIRGAFRALWLAATLLSSPYGSSAVTLPIEIIDDAGHRIAAPLQVCFDRGLTAGGCSQISTSRVENPPETIFALHIEGDAYGPVSIKRSAFQRGSNGSFRVVVPRKAELTLAASAEDQPLTLSLYRASAETFREPAFREVVRSGALLIPSGHFILAISEKGSAPDLQRLDAAPAQKVTVAFHKRLGWSLLVRSRSAVGQAPISAVIVKAESTAGFGQKPVALAESISDQDGLAIFDGIRATLVGLRGAAASFLPSSTAGVASDSSTFAFRGLSFEKGSRLIAQISAAGRPVSGALCELARRAVKPAVGQLNEVAWKGAANSAGTCASTNLAPGDYLFSVSQRGRHGQGQQWVSLADGVDSNLDLVLTTISVHGVVKRGDQPAAGYRVSAIAQGQRRPFGTDPSDSESVDPDGKYDLQLWMEGDYGLIVRTDKGAPLPSLKSIHLDAGEDKEVNFSLTAHPVKGQVVDESGAPVTDASIVATLHLPSGDSNLRVSAATDGQFEFEADTATGARLIALKHGYRNSGPLDVQISDQNVPPTAVLTLKHDARASGIVLLADGAPAGGVTVATTQPPGAKFSGLYSTSTTNDDGTFEIDMAPGGHSAFVMGPQCPLTLAALTTEQGDVDDGATNPPQSITCPPAPSTLELAIRDNAGRPVAGVGVLLQSNGTVIPAAIVSLLEQSYGLAPRSDGEGHLVVTGLSPGTYSLYIADYASEETIAAGSRHGFAASPALGPLQDLELAITIYPANGTASSP